MRFGQRKRFTVSADPGYALVGVTGCGGVLSGQSYLTDNLTDDCSVVATFSAFYRQDNGVTIACPQADVGETGIVDGVTYTKRAKADLTSANAAISCITGVTDLAAVFKDKADFNGDISHWDVSAVTTMLELFSGAEDFNQDISAWQTGAVTNMDFMFYKTKHFNQDLSGWCVEEIAVAFSFSSGNNAWTQPKPPFGQPCAAP
jgi:surface protein